MQQRRLGPLAQQQRAAERDVYREPGIRFAALSLDGRYLAITRPDQTEKTVSLVLVPVAGGQPREILRVSQPERLFVGGEWTPDSSSLIVQRHNGDW